MMPSFIAKDGKPWWLSFDDQWIKPLLSRPVRQNRYRSVRDHAQRTVGCDRGEVGATERLSAATPPELMSDSEQDTVALGGVEQVLPEGVPDKARRVLSDGGRRASEVGESARRTS